MWYNPPDAVRRENFHQGLSHDCYGFLGAHPVHEGKKLFWHFTVWAPNARQVSLTGEFCAWNKTAWPMKKQFDGTWEIRVPDAFFTVQGNPAQLKYEGAEKKLRTYKYAIEGKDGQWHLRADPFAFASEMRPNNASVLPSVEEYAWGDEKWL